MPFIFIFKRTVRHRETCFFLRRFFCKQWAPTAVARAKQLNLISELFLIWQVAFTTRDVFSWVRSIFAETNNKRYIKEGWVRLETISQLREWRSGQSSARKCKIISSRLLLPQRAVRGQILSNLRIGSLVFFLFFPVHLVCSVVSRPLLGTAAFSLSFSKVIK